MLKRIASCLAFFSALAFATPLQAQKSETGLLAAWEQQQKSDPSTTKFEKTGENRYHFATKRFPFDGELLVRNVSIQDYGSLAGENYISGTVEPELQGLTDDFYRTFAMSFSRWSMGNTLYWDFKNQKWLTTEERLKKARDDSFKSPRIWTMLFAQGWSVVFLVILLVCLYTVFRATRRTKAIMARSERAIQLTERSIQLSERNIQLQEEQSKLLQEIRDRLKS